MIAKKTYSRFQEMIKVLPEIEVVIIRMDKVPYVDQSGLYAMEEAIMDYSNDLVMAMNPGLDADEVRESFRFDAQLNAQGLAVWRARQ